MVKIYNTYVLYKKFWSKKIKFKIHSISFMSYQRNYKKISDIIKHKFGGRIISHDNLIEKHFL